MNPRIRAKSRVQSVVHAWRGVGVLFRTQANARIHAVAVLLVLALAACLDLAAMEWVALLLAMGLVLGAEALNTAIEYAVDLASPEWHEWARDAKDVAAGAVLLCSAVAAVVGAVVLLPKLWALWG